MGTRLLMPRSFSRNGFMAAVPGVGLTLNQGVIGETQGGAGGQSLNQPYGFAGIVPTTAGTNSGTTPVPVVSNLLQITDPQNFNTDLPGSFAGNQTLQPALNVFGSFLDNIQVDFLIRATQADSRSTLLTAPRLVLFNGQRSWVAVVNQQSFVSELQPQVASGAAAQRPQTSRLTTGAVLDVRATVSADRRYVTMTLRPGVGRLLDLQTFLFTTGPSVGVGCFRLRAVAQYQCCRRSGPRCLSPTGAPCWWAGRSWPAKSRLKPACPFFPRSLCSSGCTRRER